MLAVKAACEGEDMQMAHITATSESELEADKIKSEMRDVLRGSVRLASRQTCKLF